MTAALFGGAQLELDESAPSEFQRSPIKEAFDDRDAEGAEIPEL